VRKALNDNPVAQIAVLGVLALLVAFLLFTRVLHKSDSSSQGTTTTSAATGAPPAPAPAGSSPATVPGGAAAGTPSSSAPPGAATIAPDAGPGAPAPDSTGSLSSKLVAGPGLPKPVASAYAEGKPIVLFVFRNHGIDDAAVRASVERLRTSPGLAVFVTHAAGIARYSRITEGVNVNRVPALVVVRPRRLSHGIPTASVSYGFRDARGVEQAVRDALYDGPTNLPYYPR
jgi:hypothetical protein